MNSAKPLRVVDLFCGPGGVSEGLRLAGLETVYAMDKEKSAVETFARNHPGAIVERLDVTDLDPSSLPEFDILVGGPPCVEFSASKGNRGNILEGLRLVQLFLRVAYLRKPRYWIMENVPRIVLHLPSDIPLRWIGIDEPGSLHVPVRAEFNCSEYGVPQNRRRYLIGSFPVPNRTHCDPNGAIDLFADRAQLPAWRTLGDVLQALPSPLKHGQGSKVTDPNYGFEIATSQLTDQFHDVVLDEATSRQIRRAKTAHPYMGAMAFPDVLHRPARTVVATQLGRETLVIGERIAGSDVYRRATVRECGTLQSFPITYQFCGTTLGAKYRLAGDAVPPRLAYLIGLEIRKAEGLPLVPPLVRTEALFLADKAMVRLSTRVRSKALSLNRKFAQLVPGKEVRGCRVEFDNLGSETIDIQCAFPRTQHLVTWSARLYVGEGSRTLRTEVLTVADATRELASLLEASADCRERILALAREADTELPSRLPDASTLQATWSRHHEHIVGPEEVVDLLSDLVNRYFPTSIFANAYTGPSEVLSWLPSKGLRVRLAVGLLVAAYAAEIVNKGCKWAVTNRNLRYLPDGVSPGPFASTIPATLASRLPKTQAAKR